MNSLNSVLLEGDLTEDSQMIVTAQGQNVYTITIASNRSVYGQNDEVKDQEVSYFNIDVSSAKLILAHSKNLKKGRGVRIVGRLKQDRWTDTDGKEYSKIKIIAEHIEFKPVVAKEVQISMIS